MIKKLIFPLLIFILIFGFYKSQNFEEIASGVAIFLFGMLFLEQGFEAFSGGILEKILKNATNKMPKSISFGFILTTLVQSSSLVSVITISFIGASLITLTQGIGIIYGANIGTTTGAWLMATVGLKVKISTYAMPLIVFGILFIFQKNKNIKGLGYVFAGIGFLFLGIHYLKEGFESFKASIDLSIYAIDGFKGIIIFTGIGVFATVIMQSSHATIILIITALSVGQVSYENAIALVIGANIGTTITAILGSLSSNLEGKKLAGAHFIFNITTAIIALSLFYYIVDFINFIAKYFHIASDNYTLKLAIFDTFFKTMGVLLIAPWTKYLVKILNFIFKEKEISTDITKIAHARYINELALNFSETAIATIIKETKHLYDNAFDIILKGLNLKAENINSTMDLKEAILNEYSHEIVDIDKSYKKQIKGLYGEIIDFSLRARPKMQPEQNHLLSKLRVANTQIVEAIKNTKHLQKNMNKYTKSRNIYIKKQYNTLKEHLALILRNINIIATTDESDVIVLLLSKVKIQVKEVDKKINEALNQLIRKNLISNDMATSLINDCVYASNISKALISVADVLFALKHQDLSNIDELMPTDEDMSELYERSKTDG